MGGLFAIGLLLIYMSCLLQFLWTATSMTETFHKIVCFGLACVVGVQLLLNIGGVTKFIPMTGVTLPLISYGGSSVLSTFLLFNVVQGFILMKQNEEKKVEKIRKSENRRPQAGREFRPESSEPAEAGRNSKERQKKTDTGSEN